MTLIIRLFYLFFFLLLVAAPAQATEAYHKLVYDGAERSYLIQLPPRYKTDGKPFPLVIALHGGGGNAEQFAAQTGLGEIGGKANMVVVFPNGVSERGGKFRTWNAGGCCGYAAESGVDDVGFIAAVIDDVTRRYNIDAKRVFATGHSNGAMMAYRLACRLSDKVKAVVPVGGHGFDTACPHAAPVPILHIHGTEDNCAVYGGGQSCGGCFADVLQSIGLPAGDEAHWSCPPIPDFVAGKARMQGCSAETAVLSDTDKTRCESWKGCPPRGGVTLCSLKGAGHSWPGSAQPAFCKRRPNGRLCRSWMEEVGSASGTIDAGELAITFFSRY